VLLRRKSIGGDARPSQLAMGLEEQLNILIEALFIFFDRPEVISMRLRDLRAEGTAIKHGIGTSHHSAQIYLARAWWEQT